MAALLQLQPSVKPLPYLPDDVVIQILLRLPARSLFLFRSISRYCLRLIRSLRSPIKYNHNPILILRKVYNREENIVLTIISDDETLAYQDDLPLKVLSPSMAERDLSLDVHLLGPCNGVFCVTDGIDVVVFNPAIRSRRKLPRSPLSEYYSSFFYRRYGYFDHVCFGYDPVSDDYKVVKFIDKDRISDEDDDGDDDDNNDDDDGDDGYSDGSNSSGHYLFKVAIFSLSANCWRELNVVMPAYGIPKLHSYSLFFNGAFHWIKGDEANVWSILVFDLNKEDFKEFALPQTYMIEGDVIAYLSILNESLALIVHTRYVHGFHINDKYELWIMEKYGVHISWKKLYHISPSVQIERPLSFGKDGEILLENTDGQLVSFNLNTRAIKEFQVHGVPESMYAFRYEESLVSLKRSKKKRMSK